MLFRQAEPMLRIDLEDAADLLLLEPLARIAGIRAGAPGELIRGRRSVAGKAAIPAQPVTEIDTDKVEGCDRCRKEALGQCIRSGSHGSSVSCNSPGASSS